MCVCESAIFLRKPVSKGCEAAQSCSAHRNTKNSVIHNADSTKTGPEKVIWPTKTKTSPIQILSHWSSGVGRPGSQVWINSAFNITRFSVEESPCWSSQFLPLVISRGKSIAVCFQKWKVLKLVKINKQIVAWQTTSWCLYAMTSR